MPQLRFGPELTAVKSLRHSVISGLKASWGPSYRQPPGKGSQSHVAGEVQVDLQARLIGVLQIPRLVLTAVGWAMDLNMYKKGRSVARFCTTQLGMAGRHGAGPRRTERYGDTEMDLQPDPHAIAILGLSSRTQRLEGRSGTEAEVSVQNMGRQFGAINMHHLHQAPGTAVSPLLELHLQDLQRKNTASPEREGGAAAELSAEPSACAGNVHDEGWSLKQARETARIMRISAREASESSGKRGKQLGGSNEKNLWTASKACDSVALGPKASSDHKAGQLGLRESHT
ncbi:hypothetical protein AK812_SmicGene33863 [Symbiodinium microadriaticum]|uniref:Uncharacterized protein n=1 Tax=Symbiodinium microadriaticum TaxID=2951 RepID=A0A1Q9CQI4_SYMMI|nr:hypothetical protein AK812_SmicGene33863 [Symbiodinium microadriaticum]